MTNPNTQALSDAGVSIWLDDLSRELIETGKISELITERNVVGVTSNPSIFQAALSKGDRYNDDLAALTRHGKDVEEVVHELDDVGRPRRVRPLPAALRVDAGVDGRVSIEVDPRLAHDTDKTVEQAEAAARRRRPPERPHQDPRDQGRACRPSRRRSPRASAST